MSDVRNLVERLRQIAESQRMDLDSPNVAATLDDAATTLEALASIGSVVAEEPEWGIAHVATPGSVWPLSEDGARETAAIEPGQWIIYSRPKTVTHEWVPVKQEGAETDA